MKVKFHTRHNILTLVIHWQLMSISGSISLNFLPLYRERQRETEREGGREGGRESKCGGRGYSLSVTLTRLTAMSPGYPKRWWVSKFRTR